MGYLIGLTGGIATGKSTVAAMLAERGAVVIDADRVAHEAYARGSEGHASILERFGSDVLGADGSIDRMKLGAVVFNDRGALEDLNAIVHPMVRRQVARRVSEATEADPAAVVVVEAALMTETGWAGGAGTLWAVVAEPDIAIERLANSRDMDAAEAKARMATQTDNAQRRRVASVVIENNGSLLDLEAEVDAAWRTLQSSLEE